MTTEKIIEIENRLLRSELGTKPLYEWKHTSQLWLRIQKINEAGEPQYDYFANPVTTIIELQPVYVNMPMLPMLSDNWVLCRYVAADQEMPFKQRFGNMIAYPASGIWQPLQQTALRPGIVPNRTDTWNMIRGARENVEAVKQFFDTAEERQDKKEAVNRAMLKDMFLDRMTAQMEVPGKKGGTSFFSAHKTDPVELKKESVSIEHSSSS